MTLPIPAYGTWVGDIAISGGPKGAMMIGNLPGDGGVILFLVTARSNGWRDIFGQSDLKFVADEGGGIRAELQYTKLTGVKVDDDHIGGTLIFPSLHPPKEGAFDLRLQGTPTREGFMASAKLVLAVSDSLAQGVDSSVMDKEAVSKAGHVPDRTVLVTLTGLGINIPAE